MACKMSKKLPYCDSGCRYHGASIPKAFGIHETVRVSDDNLMMPGVSATGIEMLSANMILENEDGSGDLERPVWEA